jgi:hypothetical protein
MTDESKPKKPTPREQLGVLLKPENLAKTVVSQVPFASAGLEMLNQLSGYEAEKRLEALESEMRQSAKLRELEAAMPRMGPPGEGWPAAVAEYSRRIVSLAVVYDGGFHSRAQQGRELIQPVAHACIIADHEILSCVEALDLTAYVAERKTGRAIVLAGMAWYDFTSEPSDECSGLCICRLTQRDEQKWQDYLRAWQRHGLGDLEHNLIHSRVQHTLAPWVGQEVGFIHSGEAKDVLRGRTEFSKFQFDASTISHFRRPKEDSLKSFVTGVLPGRIVQAGAPAFSRDGTLLGIVSDTEHYHSDAGRRAVVRCLLGHPRFRGPAGSQSHPDAAAKER